jgi:hypothetical protein
MRRRRMEKRIQFEFSKGGIFKAQLLEHLAPKTCQRFVDTLPFVGPVLNGSFCGHIFYTVPPFDFSEVENPIVFGAQPGDIFLDTNVNRSMFEGKVVPSQVGIAYSSKVILWNWAGWLPSNHFAKIVEGNLDELYQVGRRIFWEGKEEMKVSFL